MVEFNSGCSFKMADRKEAALDRVTAPPISEGDLELNVFLSH